MGGVPAWVAILMRTLMVTVEGFLAPPKDVTNLVQSSYGMPGFWIPDYVALGSG